MRMRMPANSVIVERAADGVAYTTLPPVTHVAWFLPAAELARRRWWTRGWRIRAASLENAPLPSLHHLAPLRLPARDAAARTDATDANLRVLATAIADSTIRAGACVSVPAATPCLFRITTVCCVNAVTVFSRYPLWNDTALRAASAFASSRFAAAGKKRATSLARLRALRRAARWTLFLAIFLPAACCALPSPPMHLCACCSQRLNSPTSVPTPWAGMRRARPLAHHTG
jgi:hypothetical protein